MGEVLEDNMKKQIVHKVDIPNVNADYVTTRDFPLEGNIGCALLDENPLENRISESRSVRTEKTMPSIGGEVTACAKDEKGGEVIENNIIILNVENAAAHTFLQKRGSEMEKKDIERSFIPSENKIRDPGENMKSKCSDKSIECLDESSDNKVEEQKPIVVHNANEKVQQEKDTPLPDLNGKRNSKEVETNCPADDGLILNIPQVNSENFMKDTPGNYCDIELMETRDSVTQHNEDQSKQLPQKNIMENTNLESASVHEEIESVISKDDLGTEELLNHFKSSLNKGMEVEKEVEPNEESYSHNVMTDKLNKSPTEKVECSEQLCSEYPEKDSKEQTDKVNPIVDKELAKDEDIYTETTMDDKILKEKSLKLASVATVEELGEMIKKKEVILEGDQAYNETQTVSVPIPAPETKLRDCQMEDRFDKTTNINSQTDPSTAEIEEVICREEVGSAEKRKGSSDLVTRHLAVDLQNVEETLSTETPERGMVMEGKTTSDQPLGLAHKTDEAAGVDAIYESCEEQENETSMTKHNIKETYLEKEEDSNEFKIPKQEIHPKDTDEKRENIEHRDTVHSNEISHPNEFEEAAKENSDSERPDVKELEICQNVEVVSDSRYQDVERNGKTSQNLFMEEENTDKTNKAIKEVSHVEYKHDLQDVDEGDKDQSTSSLSPPPPGKVLEEGIKSLEEGTNDQLCSTFVVCIFVCSA